MAKSITKALRVLAIDWLIESRFPAFSGINNLKQEYPEQFCKPNNWALHCCYEYTLSEQHRLQTITDDELIAELETEVRSRIEIEQTKAAAYARIESEDRVIKANSERGEKILNSAKKGHTTVYGTVEEKENRWSEYQKEVNRFHAANPNISYAEIKRKVANKYGVSPKTIQRNTVNPKIVRTLPATVQKR